jgi:hypothetical protein
VKANRLSLLPFVAALATAAAWADSFEPPALSGTVFAYYRYDLTSMDESSPEGANEFDVSRVYVNIIGAVTDKLHYRFTADVGREEDTYYTYELVRDPLTNEYSLLPTEHTQKGRLDFFAKYAYVDVRDVIPRHHIYGGIEKTPWAPYEQEIWGWRVIRKVAFDDRGYGTTSDLGLGVGGDFAHGLVQHHLTFTNGAAYNHPEDGLSGKAVEYRLSLFPLVSDEAWKGLSVNAVVKADNLGEKVAAGEAKNPVIIYGGLLGLKHEFVNFGAGYFARAAGEDNEAAGTAKINGNVMTAYATGHYRATEGVTVHPLVRYDAYEPNTANDTLSNRNDERTLIIVGVGLKFFDDKLALIPNYQKESYKVLIEEPGEERRPEDKSIDYVYLHCQWDWM